MSAAARIDCSTLDGWLVAIDSTAGVLIEYAKKAVENKGCHR